MWTVSNLRWFCIVNICSSSWSHVLDIKLCIIDISFFSRCQSCLLEGLYFYKSGIGTRHLFLLCGAASVMYLIFPGVLLKLHLGDCSQLSGFNRFYYNWFLDFGSRFWKNFGHPQNANLYKPYCSASNICITFQVWEFNILWMGALYWLEVHEILELFISSKRD